MAMYKSAVDVRLFVAEHIISLAHREHQRLWLYIVITHTCVCTLMHMYIRIHNIENKSQCVKGRVLNIALGARRMQVSTHQDLNHVLAHV